MAGTDPIWQRARTELTLSDADGVTDRFLWEHTVRVARTTSLLLQLPEVAQDQIDQRAVLTAALFHGMGWVIQYRERKIPRMEILSRPGNDILRELAAGWLSKNGKKLLPGASLDSACAAIRLSHARHDGTPESRLLTEAENLDAVGPLAFWQLLRGHTAKGKAIQEAIEAWRTQKEYHFWEARIKEGLHHDATRKLAFARLHAMDTFLQAVEAHHNGHDLDALIGDAATTVPTTTELLH